MSCQKLKFIEFYSERFIVCSMKLHRMSADDSHGSKFRITRKMYSVMGAIKCNVSFQLRSGLWHINSEGGGDTRSYIILPAKYRY